MMFPKPRSKKVIRVDSIVYYVWGPDMPPFPIKAPNSAEAKKEFCKLYKGIFKPSQLSARRLER